MQRNDFDKALNLAYFYLKFRPRSTREVELYLQRKARKYRYSPEVIPSVLQDLREKDYLNDKKFVEMYVHDRLQFKPRSSFLLKKELEKLGIDKDLITAFFETSPVENQSTALALLRKRWLSLLHLAPKERFAKAVRYLKNKGFTYGDSISAYRSLERKNENSFEESDPTE